MKHNAVALSRTWTLLAALAGLVCVSAAPAQDRRPSDRSNGPRRTESGPRQESSPGRRDQAPSRDNGPSRRDSNDSRVTSPPPSRDDSRSRPQTEPNRQAPPSRDTGDRYQPSRERIDREPSTPTYRERIDREPSTPTYRERIDRGPSTPTYRERIDRGPSTPTYRERINREPSGQPERGRPANGTDERTDPRGGSRDNSPGWVFDRDRRPAEDRTVQNRTDRSEAYQRQGGNRRNETTGGQETNGRQMDRGGRDTTNDGRRDGSITDRRPGGRDQSGADPGRIGQNDRRPGGRETGNNDARRPGQVDRDRGRTTDRDVVRGSARDVSPPAGARPYRERARDIFTRSEEGRRYERGLTLRNAYRFDDRDLVRYFPRSYCYYPHYATSYVSFSVSVSPYHFYFGILPPYIHRSYVYHRPPRVVYIEVPVYINNVYSGYRDDEYYLGRSVWWRDDRNIDGSLRSAIEDLEDAFRYSDINRLVDLTNSDTDIAVFSRGQYQYSLRANDYLDMTRDFMNSADTVRFDVLRATRRSPEAYSVSAKHVYRRPEGGTSTVYLSFVFERVWNRWAITQVDTVPDRI